ncbi:hypothetical protein QBC46DRAFT_410281 [Diplogelasinospora grovesii]|uniref:Geranylgeranyl transferase type-2 subunit alpha n=1 Tax=Diplogelasinospora grovesii TaxID=303347 RepID=A0AAN6N534_9PEZI|nr:hypothetical protein QBC46DRAFT_410281 [Diplogelasinospora grovesii]
MESHGVARSIRARTEEQRLQDLEKIKAYRNLENQILSQSASGTYNFALFQLTTELLHLNPEYYTIWNIRRRCLISDLLFRQPCELSPSGASLSTSPNATKERPLDASLPSPSDPIPLYHRFPIAGKNSAGLVASTALADPQRSDIQYQAPNSEGRESDGKVLRSELAFTLSAMDPGIGHPSTAGSDCTGDMGNGTQPSVQDAYQGRTQLPAWGYRRFIVAKLESPELQGKSMAEDEYAYTTKIIGFNLSNFSAWHYRSQLIVRLLDRRGGGDRMRAAFLDEELSVVRRALNVGPDDQSLWYYHQFLVSQISEYGDGHTIAPALTVDERAAYLRHEIEEINDLLEDYGDIKWIYEGLLECTLALKQLEQRAERGGGIFDVKTWLVKLQALDPMRSGRWSDLERRVRD